MPAEDLNGLIAWLKSNPDKASFGTAGQGFFQIAGDIDPLDFLSQVCSNRIEGRHRRLRCDHSLRIIQRSDVGVERRGRLGGHAECINAEQTNRRHGAESRQPASQNASTTFASWHEGCSRGDLMFSACVISNSCALQK